MADIKKEQEREELHKTIWGIADDLRGSVDGWDFKQYILGIMFYRYISENLTQYLNEGEWEAGAIDFDYAKLSDEEAETAREDVINTKGFYIPPSELFCNVLLSAKNEENLNEKLENIFSNMFCFAKKLYIGSVIDAEGDKYPFDKPKHKIMGVPVKRR